MNMNEFLVMVTMLIAGLAIFFACFGLAYYATVWAFYYSSFAPALIQAVAGL